jgi:hypothetical protein
MATTFHLIGAVMSGYVAQSTGRTGLSNNNKNNSEFGIALRIAIAIAHCQGAEQQQRTRTRATAWVLTESTYKKKLWRTYPIQ